MEMSKHIEYFLQFIHSRYNKRGFDHVGSQVDHLVRESSHDICDLAHLPLIWQVVHGELLPGQYFRSRRQRVLIVFCCEHLLFINFTLTLAIDWVAVEHIIKNKMLLCMGSLVLNLWSLDRMLIPPVILNECYHEVLGDHTDQSAAIVDDWNCWKSAHQYLGATWKRWDWFDNLQNLSTISIELLKHLFYCNVAVSLRDMISQQWHLLTSDSILIQRTIKESCDAMGHHNAD